MGAQSHQIEIIRQKGFSEQKVMDVITIGLVCILVQSKRKLLILNAWKGKGKGTKGQLL